MLKKLLIMLNLLNPLIFFGVENIRNHPTCVDLRLADGTFRAIPYSYINEIIYNPAEGIEIFTPTKKVIVTGRNLKLLYNYLSAYRVKYIASNIGNDLSEEKKIICKTDQDR